MPDGTVCGLPHVCVVQGLSLIRTFEKKRHSYIFVHFHTYSYILLHFRTEKKSQVQVTCRAQNRSLAHKQNTQRHTGMVWHRFGNSQLHVLGSIPW